MRVRRPGVHVNFVGRDGDLKLSAPRVVVYVACATDRYSRR